MKTKNKKKIIVSTLAIAMGAALVGSVSGSVAWYQYSTRTTAQMVAASAGTARNLQIRLAAAGSAAATGWKQDISASDISTYLLNKYGSEDARKDGKLVPVTTGQQAKDAALTTTDFKAHPVYQYAGLPESDGTEFIQIEFEFQCLDNNVAQSGKNIYLVDGSIEKKAGQTKDISEAIRLHFASGTNYALAAKTVESTTTNGNLDLNGNNLDDCDDFTGADTKTDAKITYGTGSQASYKLGDMSGDPAAFVQAEGGENLISNDDNAYTFSGGKVLATTGSEPVKLVLTIWLEGWAHIQDSAFNNKSIWDYSLVGAQVDIALRFACQAEAK